MPSVRTVRNLKFGLSRLFADWLTHSSHNNVYCSLCQFTMLHCYNIVYNMAAVTIVERWWSLSPYMCPSTRLCVIERVFYSWYGELWCVFFSQETCDPIMCSYKLVRVKFEVWGLQTRVESYLHRVSTCHKIFLTYTICTCRYVFFSGVTVALVCCGCCLFGFKKCSK